MTTRILINCHIHTFDPRMPVAEAIAIQEGKILAAGSRADVLNLADKQAIIEDMRGAMIMPPFCDSHIHLLEYGYSLQRVDCETPSRAECLQRVAARVAQTKPGAWVLGHGWNHNVWPEGSGDKHMLDEISPENPVYLTHKSLHSAWANSAALKIAGITEVSTDPEGGRYECDQQGHLTGILLEGAMRVLEAAIPRPDRAAQENALLSAQQALLAFGITSLHDFDPWECYSALAALEERGDLKLRVTKGIPLPNLDEAISSGLRSGQGSPHLAFGWLKLFADGALGPQTAAMLAPYENSGSSGMLFLESEDVIEVGRKALPNGISLAVHAIGDRANHEIINGYAQLNDMGLTASAALPLRIEHVQIIAPQDVQRLADFNIVASMQPIHAPSDREMADRHWGDRCTNAYAWKTVQDSGTSLIFGSDAPVESPNPFRGLHAALTRKSLKAGPAVESWYPQQRLPLPDALQAYVSRPHVIAGNGNHLGRLQAGYLADLIAFSSDWMSSDPQQFAEQKPAAVMTDGAWIFNGLD